MGQLGASVGRAPRSKPQQLIDAVAVGLSVPPTCVVDRREIADFARRHGREELVTKVVSPGTPIVDNGADQYMIFTK